MIQRCNYNAIGIYTDKSEQNHNYWYGYGKIVPLQMRVGEILPFQFYVGFPAIDTCKLVEYGTEIEYNILTQMASTGLTLNNDFENKLIVYESSGLMNVAGAGVGLYYLKLTGSGETYYSDIFNWVGNDVSDLLKIECWHIGNIEYNGGKIRYLAPYKSRVYLCADVAKPSYKYDDSVEERDGYIFPFKLVSYKVQKFNILAPEYLIDFLRLIRLHDFVEITERGKVHKIDSLEMSEAQWEEHGYLAQVGFEFRTDTAVSVCGKGLTNLTYIEPMTLTCPVSIVGRYMTHDAAIAGGVTSGQYFALMEFSGVVIQLNASTSYMTDELASLALTSDSCYPVSLQNQYGLPKGAIRKLTASTTYNSDAEAATGGIAIDGIYYAGIGHESGVLHKTALIRKI